MGNTNAENKGLKIYIETEKQFYNCGSSIEGVVFVEANENFKFDALYLRIEGISHMTQESSGASGSKAAQPTAGNIQGLTPSTTWSTSSKSTRTNISPRESTLTLSQSNSLKIYQVLSNLQITTQR
jgi:hypothetical protein